MQEDFWGIVFSEGPAACDGIHKVVKVLLQSLVREGHLSNRHMDDVGLVKPVLNLTGFDILQSITMASTMGPGVKLNVVKY